jgi:hypothetical protein
MSWQTIEEERKLEHLVTGFVIPLMEGNYISRLKAAD